MSEPLASLMPGALCSARAQALLVAALCLLGAWVLLAKLLQLVVCMAWPLLVIAACATVAPHWTDAHMRALRRALRHLGAMKQPEQ